MRRECEFDSKFSNLDVGRYVSKAHNLTNELKMKLLRDCWSPDVKYDFKSDSSSSSRDRVFRLSWLNDYSPWLAYSSMLKGALCRYCVLFPQKVVRGVQGAFVFRPCVKYRNFNEDARSHMQSTWHKGSHEDATNFVAIQEQKSISICGQINSALQKKIEENRKKLAPIISSIVFCGMHDIALREKKSDSGNFHDLMEFRVEAGDDILEHHLLTAPGNAKYTSAMTQNQIIAMCGTVLRDDIVKIVNNSVAFSILADETTDVAGTEQLSMGVRFAAVQNGNIHIIEEFLGYVPIDDRTAEGLANTIMVNAVQSGLNMEKCVGQGYDGCSTMAGKEGGVQAIIRRKYTKAVFVHCSSHRLNLVVNDLNNVSAIRNTIGTIKSIITFFRDSAQRRKLVPNTPLLCETRWTEKYKSIRVFAENITEIVKQLEFLENSGNTKTRQLAHQLLSASRTSSFVVCLIIIQKYSAKLESVTQKLQTVQLDLLEARKNIQDLLKVFAGERNNCAQIYHDIFISSETLADQIGVTLQPPRQAGRQMNRANPQVEVPEDYFRITIFIPYLDSLISSLETRFSEGNKPAYNLLMLHPFRMANVERQTLKKHMIVVKDFYDFDNLIEESETWYDVWKNKCQNGLPKETLEKMTLTDVYESTEFYPSIRMAIQTALALPVSTCTIERSFSTLRRVKTWLRSTTGDERLSGLCMLSVH